jgi:hypothetical protein
VRTLSSILSRIARCCSISTLSSTTRLAPFASPSSSRSAFGPADLEQPRQCAACARHASRSFGIAQPTGRSILPRLSPDALTAEQRSAARARRHADRYTSAYAPYSGATSSVALIFRGRDEAVGGFYVESCAFNPSMTPVRSAIVAAMHEQCTARRARWRAARRAQRARNVSHLAETKTLLLSIAPNVTLGFKACDATNADSERTCSRLPSELRCSARGSDAHRQPNCLAHMIYRIRKSSTAKSPAASCARDTAQSP